MPRLVGVAAVLHRPMIGRPMVFDAPRPAPLDPDDDVPVTFGGWRRGTVTRVWVDGDLVHWQADIDDPPVNLQDWAQQRTPVPTPALLSTVTAGGLVGVAEIRRAEMSSRTGLTVLTGWNVAQVQLVSVRVRPWPELLLAVAD